MRRFIFGLCLTGALALLGCDRGGEPAPGPGHAPKAGIANPASEFCAARGGVVELVTTSEGERGDCVLPGGRRIEEWALFRAEAPRGTPAPSQ